MLETTLIRENGTPTVFITYFDKLVMKISLSPKDGVLSIFIPSTTNEEDEELAEELFTLRKTIGGVILSDIYEILKQQ